MREHHYAVLFILMNGEMLCCGGDVDTVCWHIEACHLKLVVAVLGETPVRSGIVGVVNLVVVAVEVESDKEAFTRQGCGNM